MSNSKRSWFGGVFGMVFVVAGFAVAYFSAGRMTMGYLASADWVEVPAQIQALELERSRGSDSTTETVTGRYTYSFNGQTYTSTRISLSSGKDNFSDYWHHLYSRLNSARSQNDATALVNPDNPSQAILDRTFRWASVAFSSVFITMFGGIGGFFAWASLRKPAKPQRQRLAEGEGITSDEKMGSNVLLGFGAIFFIFGAVISGMALPEELAKKNYAVLFVLIFPLVGAGIIFAALKGKSAYKRFGPTPLFLDPVSPGVGGEFGAWFEVVAPKLAANLRTDSAFTGTLSCIKRYKSGDDTKRTILWQSPVPVYARMSPKGIKGQCKIDLPADCQPSREWRQGRAIEWELEVKGDFSAQGMGEFSRSWEVDVSSAPSASSAIDIPQNYLLRVEANAAENATASALEQINLTEEVRFLELGSSAGRYIGTSVFGIIFGAIFAGVGLFTVGQDWWPGYIFIIVGGISVLVSLFLAGRAIDTKIDKGIRIAKVRRSWFGIPFSNKEAAIYNPEQFSLKQTSSTESGSKLTEFYAINIESNGKKVKLVEGIEGTRAAEALLAKILEDLF